MLDVDSQIDRLVAHRLAEGARQDPLAESAQVLAQGVVWGCQGGPDAYCAPACGAPAYSLAPGCCEFPPSCCENAWEGYCEERARTLALADRMGLWWKARAYGCRSCRGCERVVSSECGESGCGGAADAEYYSPAEQRQAAPAAVRSAPPLTPAIGRRVGYTRPPIAPRR